jgi:hypothetical protein
VVETVFGRLLVSLGAGGIVWTLLAARRRSDRLGREVTGALLALSGGGLLGVALLVAAGLHVPLPPQAALGAALLLAGGILLLHWPGP